MLKAVACIKVNRGHFIGKECCLDQQHVQKLLVKSASSSSVYLEEGTSPKSVTQKQSLLHKSIRIDM